MGVAGCCLTGASYGADLISRLILAMCDPWEKTHIAGAPWACLSLKKFLHPGGLRIAVLLKWKLKKKKKVMSQERGSRQLYGLEI